MTSRILCGDARAMLATLPEKSVHCVVTSPPYLGLRSYSTVPVDWPAVTYSPMPGLPPIVEVPAMTCELGQESTPEAYIGHLVLVWREVWRVMADDAIAFVNIGDSYANDNKWGGSSGGKHVSALHGNSGIGRGKRFTGLAPKNLIGIPWRLAFALQADGWWLRSDIIWSKKNPMPSSVEDRCSVSHEYIFMLAKAERYFYDAIAIQEPFAPATEPRLSRAQESDARSNGVPGQQSHSLHEPRSYKGSSFTKGKTAEIKPTVGQTQRIEAGGRNKRTVWEMSTQAFLGSHYAVFPSSIPTTCIKAGTSERGHCPACNKRWVRIVDRTPMVINKTARNEERGTRIGTSGTMVSPASSVTTGWQAQCACGLSPVPDVVLDCFGGAGTTALAAERLQRDSIMIELNPIYSEMSRKRIVGDAPLFTELVA